MAGNITSFVNGSQLLIKIGKVNFAYAQSLSFNENIGTQAVYGIGSFSASAIEPLSFSFSGSLSITRYSKQILDKIRNDGNNYPSNIVGPSSKLDGNSLLCNHFNPLLLLLSTTFDIEVYQRTDPNNTDVKKIYVLKDCRLTNWSMSLTPGNLVYENVSYIALGIEDNN